MDDTDSITLARFWSKVEVRGVRQCWPWQGRKVLGYGKIGTERAHRVSYRLARGEIPDGMIVRHRCHNKLCCNPRHLALGTPADNSADDVRDGRTLRGELHPRCKLTADQIEAIRTSGKKGAQLAREYGVAESTISRIRSGDRRFYVAAA